MPSMRKCRGTLPKAPRDEGRAASRCRQLVPGKLAAFCLAARGSAAGSVRRDPCCWVCEKSWPCVATPARRVPHRL